MHRHQRSPNDSSFLKKEINHPIYLNTYANLYFFHQCIFLKKPLKGKVNLICLHYLLLLEKKGYHCRSTTTKLEKANGQELLSLLTKILFIIKILIYYNQFEFLSSVCNRDTTGNLYSSPHTTDCKRCMRRIEKEKTNDFVFAFSGKSGGILLSLFVNISIAFTELKHRKFVLSTGS